MTEHYNAWLQETADNIRAVLTRIAERPTLEVHDHGPSEGRGLDCPEVMTPDGLRGACLRGDA